MLRHYYPSSHSTIHIPHMIAHKQLTHKFYQQKFWRNFDSTSPINTTIPKVISIVHQYNPTKVITIHNGLNQFRTLNTFKSSNQPNQLPSLYCKVIWLENFKFFLLIKQEMPNTPMSIPWHFWSKNTFKNPQTTHAL